MFALRHAVWRWAAVCGRSRQGSVVGINLVDPTPEAPVSENGVWIDGRFEPLRGVRLEMRLPLLRHRLRHVGGSFSGRVVTAAGLSLDLDDAFGIAEDNDTWW